jgi:hypothetical protein
MDGDIPVMQPQEQFPSTTSDGTFDLQGDDSFTWSAGRFVAHKKSTRWYATYALITIVISAAIYFMTKDSITVATFIIVAILFVFSAMHKPKRLRYMLDSDGIHIGKKMYSYQEFRAFSITDEGSVSCIFFRPFQTFAPQIAVYYDQKDEAMIANILLGRLPLEDYRTDWINWLLDRVRF